MLESSTVLYKIQVHYCPLFACYCTWNLPIVARSNSCSTRCMHPCRQLPSPPGRFHHSPAVHCTEYLYLAQLLAALLCIVTLDNIPLVKPQPPGQSGSAWSCSGSLYRPSNNPAPKICWSMTTTYERLPCWGKEAGPARRDAAMEPCNLLPVWAWC